MKKTYIIPFTVLVNCEGVSKRVETKLEVKAFSRQEAIAKIKCNTFVGAIEVK